MNAWRDVYRLLLGYRRTQTTMWGTPSVQSLWNFGMENVDDPIFDRVIAACTRHDNLGATRRVRQSQA